ncbi:MAG: hypothetical protein WBQ22_09220, partial [Bradyrhizobium sp.]
AWNSPRTDNSGRSRMHARAPQINNFGAGFLRKSLAFLIALASIAFGVCSRRKRRYHQYEFGACMAGGTRH